MITFRHNLINLITDRILADSSWTPKCSKYNVRIVRIFMLHTSDIENRCQKYYRSALVALLHGISTALGHLDLGAPLGE
jgi:hypothetical protein